jgi:hypothetical protein
VAERTLKTSRGTYRVPHLGLWSERFDAPRGSGVLSSGNRVVAIGSCFATEASRYLRRRGYPSRRYPGGLLYNSDVVRLELEHVLADRPWPAEIVLQGDDSCMHRFRRLSAPTAEELGELDHKATARARRQLQRADVVLVVLGTTTEVWRDAAAGEPTNQIPPTPTYEQGGWRLDDGTLAAMRHDVAAIALALRNGTDARQVYSVCPIPLHATWLDRNVAEANGRGKALLRVALDLELPEDATYLPLWDWMQAQSERRSPTKRDGRHFDRRGLNRIMGFAEQYLGHGCVPALGRAERIRAVAEDLRERHLGRWG